jgi:Fe-S-cluster containining protein
VKSDDRAAEKAFALNGLSVHSLRLNQDGELQVQFDLPGEQTTSRWHTQVRGVRTLNVYDDPELKEACKRLFQVVRRRVMEPDPERVKVHCDRCATSACCRNYNVLVTEEDLERLARRFGLPAADFRAKYTNEAVDWSDDYEAQLACDRDSKGEEKCVFLKPAEGGQYRCSVYEDRPRICRDFDMNCCDDFVPLERFAPVSKAPPPASRNGERPRAGSETSAPAPGILS